MPYSDLEVIDARMRRAVAWRVCCEGVICSWPGTLLCVVLAGVAWWLGLWFPLVGGPVCAILFGIVIAYVLGRLLKVDSKLTSLVGVGTGICGGAAIAAIAPIIGADDDEMAFSISTVFLFNIIAVVVFPLCGHLLHLSQNGFGIWAGTAINDTSSVVAAAFSYGPVAGQVATITKLARTTMIIPIALAFAFMVGRKRGDAGYDIRRVIPWFVFGFLLMAVLNTAGAFGHAAPLFSLAGKFLISVALAGVGLGANLRKIVKTGPRPILLGMLVWVGVAVVSLLVQGAIGQM